VEYEANLDSSVEYVKSSVEHEANLVSLVGSPNSLIKLAEQVECPYRSRELVNILESLVGSLCSLVKRPSSSDNSA